MAVHATARVARNSSMKVTSWSASTRSIARATTTCTSDRASRSSATAISGDHANRLERRRAPGAVIDQHARPGDQDRNRDEQRGDVDEHPRHTPIQPSGGEHDLAKPSPAGQVQRRRRLPARAASSHRISVTRAEMANSTTSLFCSHSVKIWDEEPTTRQKNLAGSLPEPGSRWPGFTLADRQ